MPIVGILRLSFSATSKAFETLAAQMKMRSVRLYYKRGGVRAALWHAA